MDKCTTCKYNTNDYACHPHCGGCDGQSKFTPQALKFYKTIAVDFDGTLCGNKFPDIGAPKPLVIEYIKRQAAAGAHIILHTCRENGTRRALLDEALRFCSEQGIVEFVQSHDLVAHCVEFRHLAKNGLKNIPKGGCESSSSLLRCAGWGGYAVS